jgi:diguanylate cyclase (GGDEF)-like protein/PAS domain S-box-containing protein
MTAPLTTGLPSGTPLPGMAPELLKAEERIRQWIDAGGDAMLLVSHAGQIRHANPAAAALLSRSSRELSGATLGIPVCPADGCELELVTPTGRVVQLEMRAVETAWLSESVNLITLRDVSQWARVQAALEESEARYALAARAAHDGLWDWDLTTDEVYYSPRWKAMLGLAEEEVSSSNTEWLSRIHPEDAQRVQAALQSHLDGLTAHFETEYRILHKNGSYRWVVCRALASRGEAGRPTRLAGSLADVTHRKLAEAQLAHRAFYDPLTDLPNRTLLLDRLRHALRRAARRREDCFAVLFLDVDRFKVVNDSLGHGAGDRLLVAVARRLELALRPGDSVARLGGDEFVVLLERIREASDAQAVAERIHHELAAPFDLAGNELFLSASIGIALYNGEYLRPEEVLRDADAAMYRAKAAGRARHALFDAAMHQRALKELRTEAELRRALERAELCVQYQPIVALEGGRIAGVEALVRWRHPERGWVPPGEFVPVAEECGLIGAIDRWVLREACREVHAWSGSGARPPSGFCLNVNLSPRAFSSPDLVPHVERVLRETGFPSRALRLEITESAMMVHPDAAAQLLSELKGLGVQLSIDDFGTGYSSLAHLHRFPIDSLKIDRSFVDVMGELGEPSRIATAIVTLGQNLGIKVIAEGVETARQLELLRALRCDAAQGYFFSRPLDGERLQELLSADRRW